MSILVLRGDARRLPLPDACVDLIVTSPPYFGLRSYTDNVKCYECIQMEYNGRDPRQAWPDYGAHVREVHIRHYDGQIGSEATPAEYVAALIKCTREWVRVLKPSGSLFVNLGDKYSQRTQARRSSHQPGLFPGKFPEFSETWAERAAKGATRLPHQNVINDDGDYVAEKSLMGLPWRYALAACDQLGLILRAEIIWAKPNGLPESVTDRVRRAHEQVFHFVLRPRYYSAVDEIREPHAYPTGNGQGYTRKGAGDASGQDRQQNMRGTIRDVNPLGKLPGSVWNIPSQPLTVPPHLGVDHFAAFPMELPRRIIAGWSPPGICTACGKGRRPVMQVTLSVSGGKELAHGDLRDGEARQRRLGRSSSLGMTPAAAITGYACACTEEAPGGWQQTGLTRRGVSHPAVDPAARHARWRDPQSIPPGIASMPPVRPAVVLDPFGGTGTTALLAHALGRTGITIDHSADYCRLAAWRTTDPAELARALQVPKPPPVADGQDALFDLA